MSFLDQLISNTVRADVRAVNSYQVADASGYIKLDAMENPYPLPPHLREELGARLAGVAVPPYEDSEQSFAELKARIVKTIAFLESLPQADIDGSETRAITTGSGEKTKHFTGQTYLFHYALPHFFFHATTAYDILRHNGIEVGKKDFIGSY
ncbi:MAG: DUF1993 family protein [Janthinobacterium sp.]